jgi:hypothetical protein
VVNIAYLAASFVQGSWLIAPNGGGIPSDFVNVWAAASLLWPDMPPRLTTGRPIS